VQPSLRSSRRALALSQEIKNVWAQITSSLSLTYGLLEAGAYEEALALMPSTMAQARTLPLTFIYQRFLLAQGNTYHALQQWEEAHGTLAEADAMAGTLELGQFRVPVLSQLCMHFALTGEWAQAYRYAVQAIALRESFDRTMILFDFSPQYETEALLRGGDESQARAAVSQLGERVGANRRFRIPSLRSRALLAAWDGHSEQAIGQLREAAGLAADIGLPGEQWQIQAALGALYEAGGEPEQAHTAFAQAATIIGGLAEGIKDETRRARFLAGPQIHPVLQHARNH
jgi:tetratricopeptide (TPR) repeat protein